MTWIKAVTREGGLLEKNLRSLGYILGIPGVSPIWVSEVMLSAHDGVSERYFLEEEISAAKRRILADVDGGKVEGFFTLFDELLAAIITSSFEGPTLSAWDAFKVRYAQIRSVVFYTHFLEQALSPSLAALLDQKSLSVLAYPSMVFPGYFAPDPEALRLQRETESILTLDPETKRAVTVLRKAGLYHEVGERMSKRFSKDFFSSYGNSLPTDYGWYTADEITDYLEKGTTLDAPSLDGRRKAYGMLVTAKRTTFLETAERAIADDDRPVKGNVVSGSGKIVGRVQIVYKAADVKAIPQGSIVVTPMTSPDMVPFLKKAKAIVTDEGGITCHAAIVARELSIPCIVGTGNATKALHDGEMIEMDADSGVVRRV